MCTFDEKGIYLSDYSYTGFYESPNGWMYFQDNVYRTYFVVIEGASYYFKANGCAPVGTASINGATYHFDGEQGKILYGEKITSEGKIIYYSHRYYQNTWVEIEGNKYYCDNNGYAQVGKRALAHSGVYLGAYEFDENGVLVQNITGVFKDSKTGTYHYAIDSVLQNCGLFEWNGNYYYARSNYSLVAGYSYYVPAVAGKFPAGSYEFNEDGTMVIPGAPEEPGNPDNPDEPAEKKNGIYEVNGKLGYYIDDVWQQGKGLIEWNGNYYYVKGNGTVVAGTDYYISTTNGLFAPGVYNFNEDGTMVVPV